MNIYKISHEGFDNDAYIGHVIVANSEREVRELAIIKAADEGKEVWKTAKVEEVSKYTGNKIEPFILLSDFNAG